MVKYYLPLKARYASHHEPQDEEYQLTSENRKEAIEFHDEVIFNLKPDTILSPMELPVEVVRQFSNDGKTWLDFPEPTREFTKFGIKYRTVLRFVEEKKEELPTEIPKRTHPRGSRLGYGKIGEKPDWHKLAQIQPPSEDTKENKAWRGAWQEGEMVGYARCMVDKVLSSIESSERAEGKEEDLHEAVKDFRNKHLDIDKKTVLEIWDLWESLAEAGQLVIGPKFSANYDRLKKKIQEL